MQQVRGVQGILDCYHSAFSRVSLSGPTYFGSIIREADRLATRPFAPGFQHYQILLILTDGVINDMAATIQA
jgi:hypothetical protein